MPWLYNFGLTWVFQLTKRLV